jgi:DNA-binding MarR family transcriptional regulator
MDDSPDITRDLKLLEHIEHDPDVTQANLADQLGVAVGTVNWHLKRLVAKGYVKVKRAERRKLRYIITPEGIALRTRLTVDYIDQSLRLYRRVRVRVSEILDEVQGAGYSQVYILGDGDIADICRLTCLEKGIASKQVADGGSNGAEDGFPGNAQGEVPVLEVQGMKVLLHIEAVV